MKPPNDDDPAWANVLARTELSAEAKITWWILWKQCRRRPDTEWFSYCDLAAQLGRTERSPRESVKQLRKHAFVDLVEQRTGAARLYVKRPQDVLRPDERPGFTDRQLTLPGQRASTSAAEDPSADVAPHPPASSAQHPPARPLTLEANALPPLLSLSTLKYEEKVKIRARQHPPAAAAQHPPAPRDELAPIGATIEARAQALAARQPGAELDAVAALTARIIARVDDDKLHTAFAERVARAVIERLVPARELEAALTWVDDTHRAKPRTIRAFAFIGCMRRKLPATSPLAPTRP